MSGRWPDIVCRRQISSAQSADIVLTAGQDIVHRKCPGKLFPNDREVKRFCRSGNDIHALRAWTKSTPAAWTISRLCRDDILPRSGRWPDIVCRRQISSAQSADIVLTAGQDIVHQ
ncbi:MAG: hypothetical protein IKA55_07260, partial [Akkermansia sp.]|nr:hypothetical protein [Akkermansia sp.]